MKPIYFEKSLGLDIREESAAIGFLGRQLRVIDTLEFYSFKMRPLMKNGQNDEGAENFFLDEINQFLENCDSRANDVVLSLPRSHVTLKSFDLPAPDRKSIDSMIEFELERHCSASVEDLYFSFHVHERSEKNFHIVLSAVKKDIAEYYLQLVQKTGLKVSIIDVSMFSNLNLMRSNGGLPERIATVVDLGSSSMDIGIVKDKFVESFRSVPLNDSEFSSAYFRDDLPLEYYEKNSEKIAEKIIDEIQTCLASCDRIDTEEAVDKIYLFGGGSYAESLTPHLERMSGVSSAAGAVPDRVRQNMDSNFVPSLMGTALGLGLRELQRGWIEVNLLPNHLKPKKRTFNIKTTVVLSVSMVLLFIALLMGEIIHNNLTLTSLETQLEEVKAEVGVLEKIDLDFKLSEQYVSIFKAIDRQSPLKDPILAELGKILPKDTWLSGISISRNKLEIKGWSASASKLIPILEKSAYFRDTAFNGRIVSHKEGEKFTIRSTLRTAP